jgi:hypothetical protein
VLNPTKTNGDNSVMTATGNREAGETGFETKRQYGDPLAAVKAAVECEPDDGHAVEAAADADQKLLDRAARAVGARYGTAGVVWTSGEWPLVLFIFSGELLNFGLYPDSLKSREKFLAFRVLMDSDGA